MGKVELVEIDGEVVAGVCPGQMVKESLRETASRESAIAIPG